MIFTPTTLNGAYVIEPAVYKDERGWFSRWFCKNEFAEIGHTEEWVQMNHSFTEKKATLRGMHFQYPPYGETKLVKCIAGKIFDVIIDVRKESPTYLSWFGAELSPATRRMMYIPAGFAHGFQCLEDNTELIYLHTAFYEPGHENGILWNDPTLDIKWPLTPVNMTDRDRNFIALGDNFKGY